MPPKTKKSPRLAEEEIIQSRLQALEMDRKLKTLESQSRISRQQAAESKQVMAQLIKSFQEVSEMQIKQTKDLVQQIPQQIAMQMNHSPTHGMNIPHMSNFNGVPQLTKMQPQQKLSPKKATPRGNLHQAFQEAGQTPGRLKLQQMSTNGQNGVAQYVEQPMSAYDMAQQQQFMQMQMNGFHQGHPFMRQNMMGGAPTRDVMAPPPHPNTMVPQLKLSEGWNSRNNVPDIPPLTDEESYSKANIVPSEIYAFKKKVPYSSVHILSH